jgi:hypothetical protein
MAVGAEQVFFVSVPEAGSSSVDPGLPIPQLGAVALTAQLIGFLVIDQLASGSVEHVAIFGIVAVQTPPVLLIMFEHDVVMEVFQFSPLPVDFQIGMALGTGEDAFAERRWRDRDLLLILWILPGRYQWTQARTNEKKNNPTRFKPDFFHIDPVSIYIKFPELIEFSFIS